MFIYNLVVNIKVSIVMEAALTVLIWDKLVSSLSWMFNWWFRD